MVYVKKKVHRTYVKSTKTNMHILRRINEAHFCLCFFSAAFPSLARLERLFANLAVASACAFAFSLACACAFAFAFALN